VPRLLPRVAPHRHTLLSCTCAAQGCTLARVLALPADCRLPSAVVCCLRLTGWALAVVSTTGLSSRAFRVAGPCCTAAHLRHILLLCACVARIARWGVCADCCLPFVACCMLLVSLRCTGWALAVVSSRAFRVAGPQAPAALLPLIDMANHSFTPNCEVLPVPGGVAMVAKRPVRIRIASGRSA
jgi:hypothetical protein